MNDVIKILDREIKLNEEKSITNSNVKKTPAELRMYLMKLKDEIQNEKNS
jgi:hypothetical protein